MILIYAVAPTLCKLVLNYTRGVIKDLSKDLNEHLVVCYKDDKVLRIGIALPDCVNTALIRPVMTVSDMLRHLLDLRSVG